MQYETHKARERCLTILHNALGAEHFALLPTRLTAGQWIWMKPYWSYDSCRIRINDAGTGVIISQYPDRFLSPWVSEDACLVDVSMGSTSEWIDGERAARLLKTLMVRVANTTINVQDITLL